MTIKTTITALAVAGMLTGGAAVAQNVSANNLVTVQLSNTEVLNDIANDLDLDLSVSNIPVNVQVPIGIAATVCDVNAAVLASQEKEGDATCTAKNTSTALNKVVQRQMTDQSS